eukprot:TRINITY_DN5286_c0_g1_i14.p1 TRINITY_DN5286_c0_g1~~TRINITY_DN5286_c0_g1_i14.p1  ORF type:complete len:614 (-),score=155.09 TRINITY_DN5286_c0_g1_i14:157-1998(-)
MTDFGGERFDPTLAESKNDDNEQEKILEKLQKKIKKRKLEESKTEPIQEEITESARKKKKKKKHATEESSTKENETPPITEDSSEQKDEQGEEAKQPKKRGKNKKKGNVNSVLGFTPLGEDLQRKKKKVNRILPNWLLNPDVAEIDYLSNQLPVTDMQGLDTVLTDRLQKLGFKHFFPVQRQIVPILLKPHIYRPHDVCVSAPTGSGKTLAFVLPIIQRLKSRIVPKVRAMVVLPTVDLAQQVYRVFHVFAAGTGLKVKALTGQSSMAKEQADLYRQSGTGILHQLADILVVTPGRLVRHIRESDKLDLTALRFLIIDEADRMIMNITDDWLNLLETAVFSNGRPRPGPLTVENLRKNELPLQKLLFSATLGQDPEKLEQINLFEPKLFRCIVPPKDLAGKIEDYGADDMSEYCVPAELKQFTLTSDIAVKPLMVKCVIEKLEIKSALIFTKSKEATHRLALVLTNLGFSCGELSKDVKEQRKKVLNKFRTGAIKLLVCSDALARGIDIEKLDAVISYDCPQFINAYIHRIGRTARAGREGTSVTILEPSQVKNFEKMVKGAGLDKVDAMQIDKSEYEDEMDKYHLALEHTKRDIIMEQEERANNNNQNSKRN